MTESKISFVFFDIGETLVSKDKRWIDGSQKLIHALLSDNYPLGLISNTRGLSRSELKAYLPSDFDFNLFDSNLILLSGETGIEKPDIRVFLEAIARTKSAPYKSIYVGENHFEVIAAQEAGMRSIRIVSEIKNDIAMLSNLL